MRVNHIRITIAPVSIQAAVLANATITPCIARRDRVTQKKAPAIITRRDVVESSVTVLAPISAVVHNELARSGTYPAYSLPDLPLLHRVVFLPRDLYASAVLRVVIRSVRLSIRQTRAL